MKKGKNKKKTFGIIAIVVVVLIVLIALLTPAKPSMEDIKTADTQLLQDLRGSYQHYKDIQNDLEKVNNKEMSSNDFYTKLQSRYSALEVIESEVNNINLSNIDDYKKAVKDLAQSSKLYAKANLDYIDNPTSENLQLVQAYLSEIPNMYDEVINARNTFLSNNLDENELNTYLNETKTMIIEK